MSADERVVRARARLSEIDRLLGIQLSAIRELRVEIDLRKEAVVTLRRERRAVVLELDEAREDIKGGLQQTVMGHVASGMSVRAIARELKQSPATISRLIEQAKALERKQRKKSATGAGGRPRRR